MRLQVELDQAAVERLEWLKEKTGSQTLRELFNNAMTLLNWAVKQRMSGLAIAAVDEARQEFRELQMPALEHSSRDSAKQPTAAAIAR